MVYSLQRVNELFASWAAFLHLQWGSPGTPTTSHPLGGYLGKPGPFAVLQVSTMHLGTLWGQGLSPPTSPISEVPSLILWPRMQLSSVLRTAVTAPGSALQAARQSSRADAAAPLHFREAQGAASPQASHVCMSKSTQEGNPKGKTTFLFTIHLCHLFCEWSNSQLCSGNLPKLP